MLQSPLAGTAGVLAALGLIAIPLHRLTSRSAITPPPEAALAENSAEAPTPALLRLKLLVPAKTIRLKSRDGTTLLDLTNLPAGESEHDTPILLRDSQLDLIIEADLGPATTDTAVFLTVMPDALEAQTRYLIGTGTLTDSLHFEWKDDGPELKIKN